MRLKFLISVILIFIPLNHYTEALDNGLALTPPMGWISYRYTGVITDCDASPDECLSENYIKDIADFMISEGYHKLGYEYIIIDNGWWENEDHWTTSIMADRQRFPSGMKSLADYVHSKGLKLGVYVVKTHVEEDMKVEADTFASWGLDYIKFNFGSNFDKMQNVYQDLGKALNATGRPMVYACSWPFYHELSDSTIDYEVLAKTCNVWRQFEDIQDSYESLRRIIEKYALKQDQIQPNIGPGHWDNPDMLLIGNSGLTVDQSRMQMAIWAIWAAPLIISKDLRDLRPEFKEILMNKEVIKVNQDRLGIQGKLVENVDGIETWVRPITPVVNGSYSYAIAWTNKRKYGPGIVITIEFGELNLTHAWGYQVIDLFNATNTVERLIPNQMIDVQIRATGTVFYKFIPLTKEPDHSSHLWAILISSLFVVFVLASVGVVIYVRRSPSLYAKFHSWLDFRAVKSELLDESENAHENTHEYTTHQHEVYA